MLKDRDSLTCDMAETYHILDIGALPIRLLAVLAYGLPETSRSKKRITGQTIDSETALLAIIADRLGILAWFQTEDGQKGRNKPPSILKNLETAGQPKETAGYSNGADFDAALKKILAEGG